jgi:putative DNA primase/helicase
MSRNVVKLNVTKGGPAVNAGDRDPKLEGVRVLGFDHGSYFYLSALTGQIVELQASDHGVANLCRIQPLATWKQDWPTNGKAQPFDLHGARMALMEACHAAGPFDPQRVRGRGVWPETEGRVVVHAGDWIWSGGQGWRPAAAPLGHIYEAAAVWPGLLGARFGGEEARGLLDLLEELPWVHPVMARLAAGYVVTAPVCAALPWRAQLWLIGESGSGKTTLVERLLVPALGVIAMFVQGATTEAGLRQRLGRDARPIVYDEAEANRAPGQARLERVLEFARYMASSGSAEVVKGGAGHEAVGFTGVASLLLASVNVALTRQADETRFTVIELRRLRRVEPSWHLGWCERAAALVGDGFAGRLLASTLEQMPVLVENVRRYRAAVAVRAGSARVGDQLGTLLAGARLLETGELIDPTDARAQVDDLPAELLEAALGESDQVRCLAAISNAIVRVDTESGKRQVTRTIGGLITRVLGFEADDALSSREAELALARHGIRVLPPGFFAAHGPQGQLVAVAHENEELKRILAGTDFVSGHRHLLLRLPEAFVSPNSVRFGPGAPRVRATLIPAHNFKVCDREEPGE